MCVCVDGVVCCSYLYVYEGGCTQVQTGMNFCRECAGGHTRGGQRGRGEVGSSLCVLVLCVLCADLENVVGGFHLGRSVDLPVLATCLHGRFDKAVFPAMLTTMTQTGATLSVFESGKVVIVGCENESDALYSAHLLVSALWKEAGVNAHVERFEIDNLVCKVELPYRLNLDMLFEDAKTMDCTVQQEKGKGGPSYEPETFPGMSWPVRLNNQTMTFALFPSGKGVVTGLKSSGQIHDANHFLYDLSKYEAGNEYRQPLRVQQTRRRKSKPIQP